MTDYLYSELTKKIIGCSFRTFNKLGFGYKERNYQSALAEEFKGEKIAYERELCVPIYYGSKIIGRYFLDFLVEDKVVVELKVAPEVYTNHLQQVLAYLKSNNKRLAIILLFTKKGVKIKRTIN